MAGITLRGPTLSRKAGESIRVGNIIVQFVGTKGTRAGLIRILAPEGVRIIRTELDEEYNLVPKEPALNPKG